MVKDDISAIIQEAGKSTGLMIYDSNVLLKGVDTKISVKIDKIGIISHLDCETYSKELSRRLDEADLVPNYSLEVSSPGLKRKIRDYDEFKRFINAPVKIIVDVGGNRNVIKGTLISSAGRSLTILSEGKEIAVEYSSVVGASLDY